MLKHLYSFLAGVLSVSACVIASNAQPGWMFLLGATIASITTILISRRFRRAVAGAIGTRELDTDTPASNGIAHSHKGRAALGMRGNYEPAIHEPAGSRTQPHLRERLRTATHERTARRAPITHCKRPRKAVQYSVLRTIQQDVLSALVNLKVPYEQAYKAVLASHPGDSFDELFRCAIASVNAGKSRAAA